MSGPVDVLAVMDEAASALDTYAKDAGLTGSYFSPDLRKARVAMTELIAAGQAFVSERHHHNAINSKDGGETCADCGENFRSALHYRAGEWGATDRERFTAALARCGVTP